MRTFHCGLFDRFPYVGAEVPFWGYRLLSVAVEVYSEQRLEPVSGCTVCVSAGVLAVVVAGDGWICLQWQDVLSHSGGGPLWMFGDYWALVPQFPYRPAAVGGNIVVNPTHWNLRIGGASE